MEHRQIVVNFFLPADEEPAKPVQPAMGSLDDPASRPVPGNDLLFESFFSSSSNVCRVSVASYQLPYLGKVVPFVQAQVLGVVIIGLGAIHHHSSESGLRQLHVMAIGSVDTNCYGNPVPLGEKTTFRSSFSSISRVGPSGLTPREGPWS